MLPDILYGRRCPGRAPNDLHGLGMASSGCMRSTLRFLVGLSTIEVVHGAPGRATHVGCCRVRGAHAALLTFRVAERSSRRAVEARDRAASALSGIEVGSSFTSAIINWGPDYSSAEAEDTQDRVGRLVRSLHESQRLITELQDEIDAKAAAVARLQAEEEHSRQLAALRKEEPEAVNKLISTTLAAAHDGLRRQLEDERDDLRKNIKRLQDELAGMQHADQWMFFGAGVLLSIPIGIVINILF
jgi:hypothetical protein